MYEEVNPEWSNAILELSILKKSKLAHKIKALEFFPFLVLSTILMSLFMFSFFPFLCFWCAFHATICSIKKRSSETKSLRCHRCSFVSFSRLWLNSKPLPSQMLVVHPSLLCAAPTLYSSFTPRYATFYCTDLTTYLGLCRWGCNTNSERLKPNSISRMGEPPPPYALWSSPWHRFLEQQKRTKDKEMKGNRGRKGCRKHRKKFIFRYKRRPALLRTNNLYKRR